jgi:hypothetical protein
MRSLVEKGTYAIDDYVADPKAYPGWDTIDMVMHRDRTGTAHLYSSKPPLLATIYAGLYWAIVRTTGATLTTYPYEIDRAIVFIVNVLPLVIYFVVLTRLAETYGQTDWGRIYMMAAAAVGTFLTTFAIVLNNHLPAAVCAAISLWAALRIAYHGERRWRYFAIAGFFAALTAACELPALAMFALMAAALLYQRPRETLIALVPAALVVVAAFFATNWLAHGSLIPAYAHRTFDRNSPAAGDYESTLTLASGKTITLRGTEANWYDYEFTRSDDSKFESYWRNPKGVDIGEPSRVKYALHALVGHHGIVSLTPIWLLAIPGMFWLAGRDYKLRCAAIAIAGLSIVCIAFYILRPQIERNYGGMTSGLRWMFWFAPLWLLAILPAADKISRSRLGRGCGYLLLGLSVLSASYPVWTPWTPPWLANFWAYLGG